MKKQTPAVRAKELGAKSLKQIADEFGCSVENLGHKFKTKPHQFDIIVQGVLLNLKNK